MLISMTLYNRLPIYIYLENVLLRRNLRWEALQTLAVWLSLALPVLSAILVCSESLPTKNEQYSNCIAGNGGTTFTLRITDTCAYQGKLCVKSHWLVRYITGHVLRPSTQHVMSAGWCLLEGGQIVLLHHPMNRSLYFFSLKDLFKSHWTFPSRYIHPKLTFVRRRHLRRFAQSSSNLLTWNSPL